MKATPLAIPDVILLEPKVFGDDRGFFFESFNQAQFEAAIGRGTWVFVSHIEQGASTASVMPWTIFLSAMRSITLTDS